MTVFCCSNLGYDSILTEVEVDFKQGIPGIQIVGYAGTAVKEAADRVRLAIKNSSYEYPLNKIYINLYPGSFKKESAYFDLAIAIKIVEKSGYINESQKKIMYLGELKISGEVCKSEGVLAAVSAGFENGITEYVISRDNYFEASAIKGITVYPVTTLQEAVKVTNSIIDGIKITNNELIKRQHVKSENCVDINEIIGQQLLKKSLVLSAYGFHSLFLRGAPGCGKTMAVERLQSIMPDLTEEESLETTKIYSLAGKLFCDDLITEPPLRLPHHSSSLEGLIGGGHKIAPGEISLANNGVLFLDEAGEFSSSVLQALREPMEKRKIFIARAGYTSWYPAKFILALASNLCPCGNKGRDNSVCICSTKEIQKYYFKIGAPVQDRIDISLLLKTRDDKIYFKEDNLSSGEYKTKITEIQKSLLKERKIKNGLFSNYEVKKYCILDSKTEEILINYIKKNGVSYRSQFSILKLARSIADLDYSKKIEIKHLKEAFLYRYD